jgi:hypothetical protein
MLFFRDDASLIGESQLASSSVLLQQSQQQQEAAAANGRAAEQPVFEYALEMDQVTQ